MNNSDDEQFEDTYDSIAADEEEAIEPLEVKNAAIIQSTMPGEDEKPPKPKSIFKAMTSHLSLLKGRVSELNTYLDDRKAAQTVDDHVINTIELKAGWIETKFNKIITQWEEFLDTDYDEVCRRSARGLPEVGRKCTKFENQRLLPTREEKYYSHTVG